MVELRDLAPRRALRPAPRDHPAFGRGTPATHLKKRSCSGPAWLRPLCPYWRSAPSIRGGRSAPARARNHTRQEGAYQARAHMVRDPSRASDRVRPDAGLAPEVQRGPGSKRSDLWRTQGLASAAPGRVRCRPPHGGETDEQDGDTGRCPLKDSEDDAPGSGVSMSRDRVSRRFRHGSTTSPAYRHGGVSITTNLVRPPISGHCPAGRRTPSTRRSKSAFRVRVAAFDIYRCASPGDPPGRAPSHRSDPAAAMAMIGRDDQRAVQGRGHPST